MRVINWVYSWNMCVRKMIPCEYFTTGIVMRVRVRTRTYESMKGSTSSRIPVYVPSIGTVGCRMHFYGSYIHGHKSIPSYLVYTSDKFQRFGMQMGPDDCCKTVSHVE